MKLTEIMASASVVLGYICVLSAKQRVFSRRPRQQIYALRMSAPYSTDYSTDLPKRGNPATGSERSTVLQPVLAPLALQPLLPLLPSDDQPSHTSAPITASSSVEADSPTSEDLHELAMLVTRLPAAPLPPVPPEPIPLFMSGAEVRNLRSTAHLRQAELADAIGYSKQQMSAWEAGRYPIPPRLYAAILTAISDAHRKLEELRELRATMLHWPTIGRL